MIPQLPRRVGALGSAIRTFVETLGLSVQGAFAGVRATLGRRHLKDVATMTELERVFLLERARHERSGRPASLLVFIPGGDGGSSFPRLVPVLRRRLRSTDVIGWLDANRLAALLPDTGESGAWVLAGELLDRLTHKRMSFDCEVYTYPDDWPAATDFVVRGGRARRRATIQEASRSRA